MEKEKKLLDLIIKTSSLLNIIRISSKGINAKPEVQRTCKMIMNSWQYKDANKLVTSLKKELDKD